MADYRTIADAEVDPDAPLTSSLGYAWRDNPIAIAEGATGAPRIADAALGSTVTSTGISWVAQRIVNGSASAVGRYIMAQASGSASISFGDTVAGSTLRPSSAAGTATSGTLSGTWRCQGQSLGTSEGGRVTLWLRIS